MFNQIKCLSVYLIFWTVKRGSEWGRGEIVKSANTFGIYCFDFVVWAYDKNCFSQDYMIKKNIYIFLHKT